MAPITQMIGNSASTDTTVFCRLNERVEPGGPPGTRHGPGGQTWQARSLSSGGQARQARGRPFELRSGRAGGAPKALARQLVCVWLARTVCGKAPAPSSGAPLGLKQTVPVELLVEPDA